jgi:CheY-like chemotaxis protein
MFLLNSHAATPDQKLILCVDDSIEQVQLESAILRMQGYQVVTANSGREGLDILRRELVNLVLLDYHMPDMNGGEVAFEIRRMHLPVQILIFSGSDLEDVRSQLLDLVDGLLPKNCPIDLFLSTVKQFTESTKAA